MESKTRAGSAWLMFGKSVRGSPMGDRAGHVPTNYVPPLANSINAQLFTVPLPLFTFLGYAGSASFRPFRLFQRGKFKKEKKRFTLIFLFHLFSSAAKPKFAYVFNSCQGKTFPKVSALQRGQVINFNQFDFQRLGKLLGFLPPRVRRARKAFRACCKPFCNIFPPKRKNQTA